MAEREAEAWRELGWNKLGSRLFCPATQLPGRSSGFLPESPKPLDFLFAASFLPG